MRVPTHKAMTSAGMRGYTFFSSCVQIIHGVVAVDCGRGVGGGSNSYVTIMGDERVGHDINIITVVIDFVIHHIERRRRSMPTEDVINTSTEWHAPPRKSTTLEL